MALVREGCVEMSGQVLPSKFWGCQCCGSEPSLDTLRPFLCLSNSTFLQLLWIFLFARVLLNHLLISILASLPPILCSSLFAPIGPGCVPACQKQAHWPKLPSILAADTLRKQKRCKKGPVQRENHLRF